MEKKITVSLCMIVKDEEKTLERCLNSVKSFVDEIIIVDTGSTDSTKYIANKFNSQIYDFKWINDFAVARNYSFSKATSDYIVWLDGDDFIDQENINRIKEMISNFDISYDYVSAEYILGRNIEGKINYSLRRNRFVRRLMCFKWIGHVHEYLEVYGKELEGSFSIEHGKVKVHTNRNLSIFREMEEKGENFSPRDIFYYSNELKDNGFYNEAIKGYRKFLETRQGWIEDVKSSYSKIIDCLKILNKREEIPNIAFESFKVDVPRADICCSLGEYYLENGVYNQAAFWYRTAMDCRHESGSLAMDYRDYYTSIPSLQLSICYYNLGNLNCSYFFNELAATFVPKSSMVEYNRSYFKDEFQKRNIEFPKIDNQIRVSDYVLYLE